MSDGQKADLGRPPQDIVAIFHASFHPTKGNVVDWCLKASNDLSIDGVEFSTLPSGLHLVNHDVVYFTKDTHPGVSVFRRRRTSEHGQRGFRLSALGVLLARSSRPRPWLHVDALNALIDQIYTSVEERGVCMSDQNQGVVLEPSEDAGDWEPARAFFEERMVRRADLRGAGQWRDNPAVPPTPSTPTLHLPHLLRILGPSTLTLYKHVLGRRRILIYTLPPVEPACVLCHVAADLCFEAQCKTFYGGKGEHSDGSSARGGGLPTRLSGRSREGITVLGMVTLSDLDKMHHEGKTGRGWIACTTDAIFLEKPSYYDLVIDLTTSTPLRSTRPTLYVSKPVHQQSPGSRGPTHRLSLVRFTWSDVRLWNELERILQLDVGGTDCPTTCCRPPVDSPILKHPTSGSVVAGTGTTKSPGLSSWADAWRVYEDVCLVCASLWIGSWRGNSTQSYSTVNPDGSKADWGGVRLTGDDDLTIDGPLVRNIGLGIEGRPSMVSNGIEGSPNVKGMKRSRGMSLGVGGGSSASESSSRGRQASTGSGMSIEDNGIAMHAPDDPVARRFREERLERQIRTTLALLQTFHANTCFQLSRLAELTSPATGRASAMATTGQLVDVPSIAETPDPSAPALPDTNVIYLTPRDVLSFELGPFSSLDARYLEWLGEEYGGGKKVVVKRGWKDLLGVLLGFG
ncbi:hypothetical protein F5J12DRAFT_816708 [Pisolithus orientalis]|uniref:uncharacterized protein n=1 Tax=Pisolithus orientalis TaxID=936130 RepID=UPI002225AA2A|nr:uncharacterized protein F5J12DRAFT_816708 [Pisolithus orientalis]KAI6015220.1 hypothetical protein F5J12DRAFT_816708 [Pisolithus orientalis]